MPEGLNSARLSAQKDYKLKLCTSDTGKTSVDENYFQDTVSTVLSPTTYKKRSNMSSVLLVNIGVGKMHSNSFTIQALTDPQKKKKVQEDPKPMYMIYKRFLSQYNVWQRTSVF